MLVPGFGVAEAPEPTAARACVDCRHYNHRLSIWDTSNRIDCGVMVFDPVTGKKGYADCFVSRSHERYCGPDGRWWAPKDEG